MVNEAGPTVRSAAQMYDEVWVPALVAELTPAVLDRASIRAGSRVLDVGCGTGEMAAAALGRVGADGEVAGVDLSDDMLAVARARRLPVEWAKADSTELPFASDEFDATVSQLMLMFVPRPVAALREMARVTRSGGSVTVAVWGPLEASPAYQALFTHLRRAFGDDVADAHSQPFALGDPDLLASLFGEAGLDADVTRHEGSGRFASLADWLQLELDDAGVGSIAPSTYREFVEAVGEDLGEDLEVSDGKGDGGFHFPVSALIATAEVGPAD